MQANHERYNEGLLALDILPEADYGSVFEFLASCSDDVLIFEEAWREEDHPGFGPTYENTQDEPSWLDPGE